MTLLKTVTLTIGLLFSAVQSVSATELKDASQIIKQANLATYYAGNDGRTEARMTITDGQGRTRIRQFIILRRHQQRGGDQDMMVFFSRPSDVRDTVFRVVRHPGSDDDRWLYLPALDLVKRISAGDQRTSFVGSDFYYEDVSGRNPTADTHTLQKTTDEFYVIKSTPLEVKGVEFASYQSWINKSTLLPMKVEYTDHQGNVYRRMENLNVVMIQGYPTPVKGRITDIARGSSTEMKLRGVQYDLGIPANIFSERSLRKTPTQWLRKKK